MKNFFVFKEFYSSFFFLSTFVSLKCPNEDWKSGVPVHGGQALIRPTQAYEQVSRVPANFSKPRMLSPISPAKKEAGQLAVSKKAKNVRFSDELADVRTEASEAGSLGDAVPAVVVSDTPVAGFESHHNSSLAAAAQGRPLGFGAGRRARLLRSITAAANGSDFSPVSVEQVVAEHAKQLARKVFRETAEAKAAAEKARIEAENIAAQALEQALRAQEELEHARIQEIEIDKFAELQAKIVAKKIEYLPEVKNAVDSMLDKINGQRLSYADRIVVLKFVLKSINVFDRQIKSLEQVDLQKSSEVFAGWLGKQSKNFDTFLQKILAEKKKAS